MVKKGSNGSFVDFVNTNSKGDIIEQSDKEKSDQEKARNHEAFNDELDKAFERNEERNSKSDLQKLLKKNAEMSLSSITR